MRRVEVESPLVRSVSTSAVTISADVRSRPSKSDSLSYLQPTASSFSKALVRASSPGAPSGSVNAAQDQRSNVGGGSNGSVPLTANSSRKHFYRSGSCNGPATPLSRSGRSGSEARAPTTTSAPGWSEPLILRSASHVCPHRKDGAAQGMPLKESAHPRALHRESSGLAVSKPEASGEAAPVKGRSGHSTVGTPPLPLSTEQPRVHAARHLTQDRQNGDGGVADPAGASTDSPDATMKGGDRKGKPTAKRHSGRQNTAMGRAGPPQPHDDTGPSVSGDVWGGDAAAKANDDDDNNNNGWEGGKGKQDTPSCVLARWGSSTNTSFAANGVACRVEDLLRAAVEDGERDRLRKASKLKCRVASSVSSISGGTAASLEVSVDTAEGEKSYKAGSRKAGANPVPSPSTSSLGSVDPPSWKHMEETKSLIRIGPRTQRPFERPRRAAAASEAVPGVAAAAAAAASTASATSAPLPPLGTEAREESDDGPASVTPLQRNLFDGDRDRDASASGSPKPKRPGKAAKAASTPPSVTKRKSRASCRDASGDAGGDEAEAVTPLRAATDEPLRLRDEDSLPELLRTPPSSAAATNHKNSSRRKSVGSSGHGGSLSPLRDDDDSPSQRGHEPAAKNGSSCGYGNSHGCVPCGDEGGDAAEGEGAGVLALLPEDSTTLDPFPGTGFAEVERSASAVRHHHDDDDDDAEFSILLEEAARQGGLSDVTGHSPLTPKQRLRIQMEQRRQRQKRRSRLNPSLRELRSSPELRRRCSEHSTRTSRANSADATPVEGKTPNSSRSPSPRPAPLPTPRCGSTREGAAVSKSAAAASLPRVGLDEAPVAQRGRLFSSTSRRSPPAHGSGADPEEGPGTSGSSSLAMASTTARRAKREERRQRTDAEDNEGTHDGVKREKKLKKSSTATESTAPAAAASAEPKQSQPPTASSTRAKAARATAAEGAEGAPRKLSTSTTTTQDSLPTPTSVASTTKRRSSNAKRKESDASADTSSASVSCSTISASLSAAPPEAGTDAAAQPPPSRRAPVPLTPRSSTARKPLGVGGGARPQSPPTPPPPPPVPHAATAGERKPAEPPAAAAAKNPKADVSAAPTLSLVRQVLIPLLLSPSEKERTATVVFDLDETLCNNHVMGPALLRPGAVQLLKYLRSLYPRPLYKPLPTKAPTEAVTDRLYGDALKYTGLLPKPPPPPPTAPKAEDSDTSYEGLRLEMVLWTASVELCARPVVERLDPQREIFDQLIFRDIRWYSSMDYTKDLSRLGRSMDRCVIVENAPASVYMNRHNAILVHDFVSNRQDRELCVVKAVLTEWMEAVHGHLMQRVRERAERVAKRLAQRSQGADGGEGGENPLPPQASPLSAESNDGAGDTGKGAEATAERPARQQGVHERLASTSHLVKRSYRPATGLTAELPLLNASPAAIGPFLSHHGFILPRTNYIRLTAVPHVMRKMKEEKAAAASRASGAEDESNLEDTTTTTAAASRDGGDGGANSRVTRLRSGSQRQQQTPPPTPPPPSAVLQTRKAERSPSAAARATADEAQGAPSSSAVATNATAAEPHLPADTSELKSDPPTSPPFALVTPDPDPSLSLEANSRP